MDEKEKQIRQNLKNNFEHYALKCLRIRTKSGSVEPFLMNTAQKHIHETVEEQKRLTGKVRAIILKGRQMGCSTLITGRFYHQVTHRFGVRAFILTHEQEATNNLFEMTQRYNQYCPDLVKPSTDASNAKELIFGKLDSGYKIGTAGNKSVGRSSTVQLLHGSEVAYWPNAAEHAKGILQAVPNEPGTEVFIESTANGLGNYFHEQWQMAEAGISDFIPIFVPWFWQTEYRREVNEDFSATDEEQELIAYHGLKPEQLMWRRYKIIELSVNGLDGTKAFNQEYPNTSFEAFTTTGEDGLITPDVVMRARKDLYTEGIGKIIIGVDPARFGDDRTAIIRRQGRLAYKLETHTKKSTMEIANLCHKIILDEKPFKMCIDIGGLGAGVYDRLSELGHDAVIIPVNGGETPLDQTHYFNKRAEMWGEMKQWLVDTPCKVPDDNALHADLCSLRYRYDSKTRLVLEKKEDMKRRGLRSCDTADALALTFSIPQSVLKKDASAESKKASNIMGNFLKAQAIRTERKW